MHSVSGMVSLPLYGNQKQKGHLCKLEMQHMFKMPGIKPPVLYHALFENI